MFTRKVPLQSIKKVSEENITRVTRLEAILDGEHGWFLECVDDSTVDSLPVKRMQTKIKLKCKKVSNG